MGHLCIHPHKKGFINTVFSVFSYENKGKSIIIKSSDESSKFEEINLPLKSDYQYENFTLNEPGTYLIYLDGDENNSRTIEIEDAIRFGGSKLKASYIFDEIPWTFIVMFDRTYFYNIDSKESYVENISPDEIRILNNDVIILSSENRKKNTLYSLKRQCPIINFHKETYLSSDTLVICDEAEELKELNLFKFNSEIYEHVTVHCNMFSINPENSHVYTYYNETLSVISLMSLQVVKEIKTDGEFTCFTNNKYAVMRYEKTSGYTVVVSNIEESKKIASWERQGIIEQIEQTRIVDERTTDNLQKMFELQNELGLSRFSTLKYTCSNFKNIFICCNHVYYVEEITTEQNDIYGKKSSDVHVYFRSADGDIDFLIDRWSKIKMKDNAIFIIGTENKFIINKHIKYNISSYNVYENSTGMLFAKTYPEGKQSICECREGGLSEILKGFYDWTWFEDFNILKSSNKGIIQVLTKEASGYWKTREVEADITYAAPSEKSLHAKGKTLVKFGVNIVKMNSDLPIGCIAISQSTELMLSKKDKHIFLYRLNKETSTYTEEEILKDVFDPTYFHDVFLSDDGNYIIYREDKDMILLNTKSLTTETFPELSFIGHKNGFRPLFAIDKYRRPRLVDPLTKNYINEAELAKYTFISPDGHLYADTELGKYIKYENEITECFISSTDYTKFCKKYDYTFNRLEKAHKEAISERERFIDANADFFTRKNLKKSFLLQVDTFTRYFIKQLGFAYVRDAQSDEIVEEIPLGPTLWFLNYVSFSKDSRYVGIAGRYPNHTIENDRSISGLLLIYDLKEHKVLCVDKSVRAVWTIAFSPEGDWGAYSGTPTTFLGNILSENFTTIENKNFISFSPDGKYMVLSDQGYIPYSSTESENWGHQSSTNVFIHKVCDPQNPVIPVITDLAGGGIEDTYLRESVASCSFSSDNTKLMMVGNDGVVIIRNIHLDNI